MNRKTLFFLLITFQFFFSNLFAQIDPNAQGYYVDALRISQNTFGGTARFQGIGGANVALGGDMSAAYMNPAGLGFMRRSQVAFTPSLNIHTANTDFLGQNTLALHVNFNINQMGLVIASGDRGADRTIRNTAFAISFTRTNDFQQRRSYAGQNRDNSLIDYFMERNDGYTPWDDLDAQSNGITNLDGLAYYTYLINPYSPDNTDFNSYYSFVPKTPIEQEEKIRTVGANNAWNLSYGLNIVDRVYIGANVGLNHFDFKQNKTYTETVVPQNTPLDYFRLNEEFYQTGFGLNASLGIILRPIDAIRLGAKITSPTITGIWDTYSADLEVKYNNYAFEEEKNGVITVKRLNMIREQTEIIKTDYVLLSPMRFTAGAAIFLGKHGFLTGDLEWVDYTKAELSNPNPNFSFRGDNNTIAKLYRSTLNFRGGAEFRFNGWRVRGGYAYYADPYQVQLDNINRSRQFFTGGFGRHEDSYFWDLTLIQNASQVFYKPYNLSDGSAPASLSNLNKLTISFTFGIML